MRGFIVILLSLCVGFGLGQAQSVDRNIVRLNHIAIAVEDFAAESEFYSEVLGFPEAFSFRREDGTPIFTYFQINQNTFVELMPVTADRPAGLTHFGLESTDADAMIEHLKAAGVDAEDANFSSFTAAKIAPVVSPSGTFFEILEFGPESMHRKVMDSWR